MASECVERLVVVIVGVERPVAEILCGQWHGAGRCAGEVVGCHGVTLPCALMPPKTYTTAQLQARTLKRGERVRLVADLPGVPEGSEGKVAMANGFTWNRYWVRLVDGRVIGHIDHGDLVRTKDYQRFLVARDREADEAATAAQRAADAEADAPVEAAGSDGAAGGGTAEAVVNGVAVPAYLLQRSADARSRLGA